MNCILVSMFEMHCPTSFAIFSLFTVKATSQINVDRKKQVNLSSFSIKNSQFITSY